MQRPEWNSSDGRPVACTLLPTDLKKRLEELARLTRDTLLSGRQEGLVLHLTYKVEAEERVLRMVEKEKECCAFLNFEFCRVEGAVALTITAPEAARESVAEIYAQFIVQA